MKKRFKQFLEELASKDEVIDNWLSLESIEQIWLDANEKVFDGHLTKPKFTLEPNLNYLVKRYQSEELDGDMLGYCDKEGSKIILRFSKKIKNVKELLEVVVHEMVHQAEAERTSYLKMHADPHGQAFLAWAPKVKKYHGIDLETIMNDD